MCGFDQMPIGARHHGGLPGDGGRKVHSVIVKKAVTLGDITCRTHQSGVHDDDAQLLPKQFELVLRGLQGGRVETVCNQSKSRPIVLSCLAM